MSDNRPRTTTSLTGIQEEAFRWKWAVTTNRILSVLGKELHPVPEHSKMAEAAYWREGRKQMRARNKQ